MCPQTLQDTQTFKALIVLLHLVKFLTQEFLNLWLMNITQSSTLGSLKQRSCFFYVHITLLHTSTQDEESWYTLCWRQSNNDLYSRTMQTRRDALVQKLQWSPTARYMFLSLDAKPEIFKPRLRFLLQLTLISTLFCSMCLFQNHKAVLPLEIIMNC